MSTTITLSKALKLKNRIQGRISQLTHDIRTYATTMDGGPVKVEVHGLLNKRTHLAANLVALKSAIAEANAPIRCHIFWLGEIKSAIALLRELEPAAQLEGLHRRLWREDSIAPTYSFSKEDIDQLVAVREKELDGLQDEIDVHNASTKITIEDSILEY